MDIELIKKYFRNECSEEEVKQVLKMLNDPSKEQVILSSIELSWLKFEDEELGKQKAIEEIKEKINARMNPLQNEHVRSTGSKTSKKSIAPFFWKAAAVIFLITSIGYFVWLKSNSEIQSPEYSAISSNYLIKTNPKGKKLQIKLTDGSMVILNSESKISYKENNFVDSIRAVYLEGEAYFEVARNDTVPFIVSTRNLTITALGTAFNVRTYTGEGDVNVALKNGKVMVEQKSSKEFSDNSVILNPGQIVTYSKSAEKFSSIGAFDFDEQLGWIDGILNFNGDDFTEVMKKLERWYGVEIVILNQDKASDWSYSGKYRNVALENVLIGIGYTKSFEYEIKNKMVFIKFT